MPKLTKRFVEATEIKEKAYCLFDELIPGFCIRISPKGKRYYYFQYIKNKVRKRILLGQHGIITSEQAREEAIARLGDVKIGGDPHKIKIDKKLEPLIKDVSKRFMDEHAIVHCRATTQKGYHRYLNKHILPFFGNMKVSEVTRADISLFHNSLQKTPYEGNRCLEVISKMFNLAETWGLRSDHTNPCYGVKKFPMKARERYLTSEEAKKLGDTLDKVKQYPEENLAAVYCIQLLLLTGCRLSEIRTLKWEYIDYENKLLRLPDSKTGAKTVYAGSTVMDLLEEIKSNQNRPQDNPYVIWGKHPNSCLNNVQKAWRRFRKLAGLEGVRIHDLRHSFASFAVNNGTSLAMIGKLLGHTQVQTTARYAHLMAEPMIATAESVTNGLGSLLKIQSTRAEPKEETNFTLIKGTTIKTPVYLTSDQAAKYLNVKLDNQVFQHGK